MDTALGLGKEYCDAFNAPGVSGEILASFYATDCKFMPPKMPTVYGNASQSTSHYEMSLIRNN